MNSIPRAQFLMATAATLVATPRSVRAQTLEKIRIGAVPTDDMTPIFYAIKNGFYQKAGLDVEVITTPSGSAATAAVVGGAYELAKASPMASLVAHLKGFPLTIVANGAIWIPKSPFNLMLVAADSPIKTGADCNGKIGGAPGLNDVAQLAILQWVDKHGGDSSTMKWVEIPNSALGAAIAEHRVDIGDLNEPQLTAAIETKRVRPLGDAFTAIAEKWVASIYLAHPDWAKKNVSAVRRWVRVTYETAAYQPTRPDCPDDVRRDENPDQVFQKMADRGTTSADPGLLQPVIELGLRQDSPALPAEMYFSGLAFVS